MTASDGARVTAEGNKQSMIVTGGGSMTFANSGEFGERLKEAASEAEAVTADLRPAVFIDHQIITDLVNATMRLSKRGKRLRVIVAEGTYPAKVLSIIGLQSIMDVEADSACGPAAS